MRGVHVLLNSNINPYTLSESRKCLYMPVYCLTWCFNCNLLVKGSPEAASILYADQNT